MIIDTREDIKKKILILKEEKLLDVVSLSRFLNVSVATLDRIMNSDKGLTYKTRRKLRSALQEWELNRNDALKKSKKKEIDE